MNTCPVYRRSGGHSYGTPVAGPIGSVLAPASDPRQHRSLPFACSLCGSCSDVCPVRIPLHEQLLASRRDLAQRRLLPAGRAPMLRVMACVLSRPRLFAAVAMLGRLGLRGLPRALVDGRWNAWGRGRELPRPPRRSFRALLRERAPGVGAR